MSAQIQTWLEEHRNFGRLLQLLDGEIAAFHAGDRPDYDLMLDVMYYMTHYPDGYHHPLEDAAFAELSQQDDSAREEVEALFEQHRDIERHGAPLLETLQGALDGAVMARDAVERSAAAYSESMRTHMQREESFLFPRLENVLSDEDWARAQASVARTSDPLFGDAVAERYRGLQRRIARYSGCGCEV